MKRAIAAGMASLALLTAGTVPASAEQSVVSLILFGRIYNDNVTAIQVGPGRSGQDSGIPQWAVHPSGERVRTAQAAVAGDPRLQQAMSVRKIALHNLIAIQTAANGNTVIYYR